MDERLAGLVEELRAKGILFRLIELNDRAVSIDDVVRLSKGDIRREEICKTMIVKTGAGYRGAFLKGDRRVDFDKLRALLGSEVRLASLKEVREVTGVDPGAVCPLLLGIPLLMDRQVMGLKKVNFGSGDHLYGIEMGPKDLADLRKAQIADIC